MTKLTSAQDTKAPIDAYADFIELKALITAIGVIQMKNEMLQGKLEGDKLIELTAMCRMVREYDDDKIANCLFYAEIDLRRTIDVWFDVIALADYSEKMFYSVNSLLEAELERARRVRGRTLDCHKKNASEAHLIAA